MSVTPTDQELETQRERVPRVDAGELETALAFLDFVRHCAVKKTEGLSEEQLRERHVPSGTNLLGLVSHLTDGERYWFALVLDGQDIAEPDWDRGVPEDRSVSDVLTAYAAAVEESNAIVRRIGDPSARVAVAVDGQYLPMRWVIAHMTGETARHAGHADILRELTDGVTGR